MRTKGTSSAFVAWALAAFGQPAHDAMQAEVTALEAQASAGDVPGADADRDALLADGILTDDLRHAIRRTAIRSLVVPLATAVLESQHRGPSVRDQAKPFAEWMPA
jgi:hypothetical protein